MSTRQIAPAGEQTAASARPLLLFFYSAHSGKSRRVEGFLAQVLQRRRNHDTFQLRRIDYDQHQDLARRCGIDQPPALVVVTDKHVQARIEQPRGCVAITETLAPWLY
jgi:thioredoxin-like negative regulator of GroEL